MRLMHRAAMRVSVGAAGVLLAMLAKTMLPMRWGGAPAPAVVPTSNTSAARSLPPSCPSWEELVSTQLQPTSRLYDLALSKLNSATAGTPVATFINTSSTASPLLILGAVIPLAWLAMYVLGAVLLGLARASLRLAVFVVTVTVKCPLYLLNASLYMFRIVLRMAISLLSVPLYLLKMTVRAPIYLLSAAWGALWFVLRLPFELTQHAMQQQRQQQQQLVHIAPAGAAQPMQHEEQPDEQPELQPEGAQPQDMHMLMRDLEAMTIAELRNLVVEQFGISDEFMRLNRKGTKADLVAFIRLRCQQL